METASPRLLGEGSTSCHPLREVEPALIYAR